MFNEITNSIFASIGGAAVIIAALSHFLGKVWADRIATQTISAFNIEIENIKNKGNQTLENIKSLAAVDIKEKELFSSISLDVYQVFFKKRIEVYTGLLEIKNKYIEKMHEDFMHEDIENYGNAYHSIYSTLRKLLIENQLYISNELENSFHDLRIKAAEYTKEADMIEMSCAEHGVDHEDIMNEVSPVYGRFCSETYELMNKVIDQITKDVSGLRSRIEIDRPNNSIRDFPSTPRD